MRRPVGTRRRLFVAVRGHKDYTDLVASIRSPKYEELGRTRIKDPGLIRQPITLALWARLTTNGLGATRPIDSNDTPKGRAHNRRVEFVRQ